MILCDTFWLYLHANYDAYQLIVLGTFGLVIASYWLCGLTFLALDLTRWHSLYRFKIQPNVHLDVSMLPGLFQNLLVGQIFVMLPAAMSLHALAERGMGVRLESEPPATSEATGSNRLNT